MQRGRISVQMWKGVVERSRQKWRAGELDKTKLGSGYNCMGYEIYFLPGLRSRF